MSGLADRRRRRGRQRGRHRGRRRGGHRGGHRGSHRGSPRGRRRRPGRPARSLRPAFGGAEPSAPSFEDEIRAAVSYERGLAAKAFLSIALVVVVLALRVYFFG
jgi:hypothetical protein